MLTTKGESIDAREGGGSSRSSDEDAVMALEPRGCGSLHDGMANQRWEEPPRLCIASVSKGIVEMAVRSRMSREVHVRSLWGTGGEIPPVDPAFGGAKGKGASGGPARPNVPKHRAGADCSVVAMKRVMPVERSEQPTRLRI